MDPARTWDLTQFFPNFDSPERLRYNEKVTSDVGEMLKKAIKIRDLSEETFDEWANFIFALEDLEARFYHYYVFVSCLTSADSANEAYQQEMAAISQLEAQMEKLGVEILRAIKPATDEVFSRFLNLELNSPVRFYLSQLREKARNTMEPLLEGLGADLNVYGIVAWGRLYNQIAGKLSFEMEFPDGRHETVPMSKRRSLMEDNDRKIREAAFRKGNEAWAKFEDVTCAALNNIAGTRLMLNKRRGIDHFLEVALFQSRISRKTLDSIFEAISSCRPFIQEIGRTKARALGFEKLAWYDIDAPLPLKDTRRYTWEEGLSMIEESFNRCFPELCDFFKFAIESRWIESEVREGKRPGGYCTGSLVLEQARIFMTYNGSLGDIRTLAHEIGHAYHSHVMKGLRTSIRSYPMTLAESASTFAESLLSDGVLSNPEVPDTQKVNILNSMLSDGMAFLMDIPVRYEFEKAFHEEREKGEVSVGRLKEIMSCTQRRIFGDILADDGVDPYFWASKLHFYITDVTFYNFPYTFGFLLSQGLNSKFKTEGTAFLSKYKEFLKFSGSDTAENVARKTMGLNLEKPDFWIESIRNLESVLVQFNEILAKITHAK